MSHSLARFIIVALAATTGTAAALSAQDQVPVTAAVTVGGQTHDFNGMGECRSSDDASIYNVPAAMWTASFTSRTGGLSRVNVTVWQLKKGGAAQVTFVATAGSASYEIATVTGGRTTGSGTARVEKRGTGGSIVVDGRTAKGEAISATVTCGRFLPAEDNG